MRVLAAGIVAPIALLLVCGFASDTTQSQGPHFDTDVIVTAAPAYQPFAVLRGQERFPKGAQLLLLHEGKTESLVEGFAATADADLSFDAMTVLFSGKKAAGDPWQIWELRLADHSLRKVVSAEIYYGQGQSPR